MKKGLYYKEVFSLLLPLCLGLIIAIDVNFILSKDYYAPELDFSYFLQLSRELVQNGKMWRTALYPPGVPLILAIIQLIGIEIDHFIFKSVILFLWLLTAYLLSRSMHGKSWWSFLSVLAMLLHPYFIWTGLMSKDSAVECLSLFLSFLVLMKLYSSRIRGFGINTLILAGIFILLSLTSLIRVTNVFIVYALLGVLLIMSKERIKKYFFSFFYQQWCYLP